jgi:hypothetical protein
VFAAALETALTKHQSPPQLQVLLLQLQQQSLLQASLIEKPACSR